MTQGRELAGWHRGDVFRLCLDLNVWTAVSMATARGRTGTASLALAEAVRRGTCALGPTQLVVSWGMLNRLRLVLQRKLGMSDAAADAVIANIETAASLGPAEMDPLLVLGGTGVSTIRDEEDLHVLEAAIAGRANLVATYDWNDFNAYRNQVLVPGRVALHRTADHELLIAHPAEAARWVRTGEITLG